MKKISAWSRYFPVILSVCLFSVLWSAGGLAQVGKIYGFFTGDLRELAPQSVTMIYNVNDPPGTFENYDTGYFEYRFFDVDQATRSVKGNIQLNINATKWTKPLPGRKNFDYTEKRTDHAGGYMIGAKMTAGNIDLDASLTVGGTLVHSPKIPDIKLILHEMIAKVPAKGL